VTRGRAGGEPRSRRKKMRNVLLLIKGLGRGGAEQLVLSAVRHGDRTRVRYGVAYLLPWKDALVPEAESAGAWTRCLEGGRGPAWIGRLRALVRDEGIDVIHVHSPYPAIGARLGLPRRIPLVYTEHNVWQRYHRATYWGNVLTYPRNDHVFAVSDEVRRSVRYPRGLRFRRMPEVETLHHGAEPAILEDAPSPAGVREELGIPPAAPLVGTVANLKHHKGLQHLLRAVNEVRKAVPDVRFVIVGQGPAEGGVRALASELGLDGTVTFTGFREDALRIAAAFDLFVLSSLYEGLSIALVEAMALSRPVVVTRVGGLPEVVEDGRQGILVEPADPQALAAGIVTLLGDPDRREEMGRAGRRRAADLDVRKAIRRAERVYEELAEGKDLVSTEGKVR
jgi:glycosyltransferase involved in cell wall biosynthesis